MNVWQAEPPHQNCLARCNETLFFSFVDHVVCNSIFHTAYGNFSLVTTDWVGCHSRRAENWVPGARLHKLKLACYSRKAALIHLIQVDLRRACTRVWAGRLLTFANFVRSTTHHGRIPYELSAIVFYAAFAFDCCGCVVLHSCCGSRTCQRSATRARCRCTFLVQAITKER